MDTQVLQRHMVRVVQTGDGSPYCRICRSHKRHHKHLSAAAVPERQRLADQIYYGVF
jgi:hypothetical protein